MTRASCIVDHVQTKPGNRRAVLRVVHKLFSTIPHQCSRLSCQTSSLVFTLIIIPEALGTFLTGRVQMPILISSPRKTRKERALLQDLHGGAERYYVRSHVSINVCRTRFSQRDHACLEGCSFAAIVVHIGYRPAPCQFPRSYMRSRIAA